jgi:hypothetical protein
VSTDVKAGVRVIAAIYLIAAILWLGAMLAGDNAAGGAAFFVAFMVSVIAVYSSLYGAVVLLDSLRRKPSGRQPPASEGGKASRSRHLKQNPMWKVDQFPGGTSRRG